MLWREIIVNMKNRDYISTNGVSIVKIPNILRDKSYILKSGGVSETKKTD
jgi:hypothetical protein